jgi:hypothetical protein
MPRLMARPFPSAPSDLNLAMRSDDPASVTGLLSQCLRFHTGESVPLDSLWALEIEERIAWLLRITACSGAQALVDRTRCGTCKEFLEIDLSIDDLLGLHQPDASTIAVVLNDRTVAARRPTGDDQRAWAQADFATVHQAVDAAAMALLLDADVALTTDDAMRALEDALSASNPLCHFSISAACPYCGTHTHHEIDLAALAMRWLDEARDATIETVHALARAYHWTEADVFAIAPSRRDRYLALIDRDDRIRR